MGNVSKQELIWLLSEDGIGIWVLLQQVSSPLGHRKVQRHTEMFCRILVMAISEFCEQCVFTNRIMERKLAQRCFSPEVCGDLGPVQQLNI